MPQKKQKRAHIADADYAQFLKSIEPVGIVVIASQFRVDRDRCFQQKPAYLSVSWGCEPREVGGSYFEADAELTVKLSVQKASEALAEIRVTFRMHIHTAKNPRKSCVDRFLGSEVRILVWPYFREYVTNVCGRMGIPLIVLPVGTKE